MFINASCENNKNFWRIREVGIFAAMLEHENQLQR